MEDQEYHSIYLHEEKHWWYVGLRNLVHTSLRVSMPGNTLNLNMLDAGCGAGRMLEELTDEFQLAVGVDMSPIGLKLCQERGLHELACSTLTKLPFKDKSFDAAVSLDVLYHKGIDDDMAALKEILRVLKDNGVLILNLPAYEFLRGSHDEQVHTRERYTKKKLAARLTRAGFIIEKISYRNAFLFPLIIAVRTLQRISGSAGNAESDLKEPPIPINGLLKIILRIENLCLKFINMPFGSSVFCIARKKPQKGAK